MAAASRCPEQRAVLALRPVRSVLALDGRGVWGGCRGHPAPPVRRAPAPRAAESSAPCGAGRAGLRGALAGCRPSYWVPWLCG